jgi:AcrR family transcriptional regulator
MTETSEAPAAVEPGGRGDQLTRSQAARRQRVITAALELSSTGGYDAVQMRDVAARAEVALGTIYRYFSSQDHLLAAVLVDWMIDLERRVSLRPPKGDTTAERVVDILRRASRAMEKDPNLSAAVITALSSPDRAVADCQGELTEIMARIQSQAFPLDFDPDIQTRVIRVLGFIWFTSLMAWVNDWAGASDTGEELASATHLLLDQYH